MIGLHCCCLNVRRRRTEAIFIPLQLPSSPGTAILSTILTGAVDRVEHHETSLGSDAVRPKIAPRLDDDAFHAPSPFMAQTGRRSAWIHRFLTFAQSACSAATIDVPSAGGHCLTACVVGCGDEGHDSFFLYDLSCHTGLSAVRRQSTADISIRTFWTNSRALLVFRRSVLFDAERRKKTTHSFQRLTHWPRYDRTIKHICA